MVTYAIPPPFEKELMKKFVILLQVYEGGLYLTSKFGIHLKLTFKNQKCM
jgi:hypothetical protein